MTLEEQLKAEILSKYKSIRAFTQQFGISYSTLDSIFKRGIKNAGIDTILKIFGALNIDIESVKSGSLRHISSSAIDSFFTPTEQFLVKKHRTLDKYGKEAVDSVLNVEHKRCTETPAAPNTDEKVICLPEPLQAVSAGFGQLADDETATKVAVLYNSQTAKADYIMRVRGDSMEPEILDGERVLVRKQPAVEPGEIGIFIRGGERYVKIYRGDHLESINPAYDDVSLEEYSVCVGKVICKLDESWVRE